MTHCSDFPAAGRAAQALGGGMGTAAAGSGSPYRDPDPHLDQLPAGGTPVASDDEKEVTTLRLPGINWLLQWRSDGFWRDLNDAQYRDELSGLHAPSGEEWVEWSGISQPQARGGEWGGTSTWWLIYGEVPAGSGTPSVALADGTRPPVLLLGRLWACEWRAVAQPATVRVGREQFHIPFAEPEYRRLWGMR